MGSAQAEKPWRGGATVSSSSLAFGWQLRRRSEVSEWRRKERMRPLALRGSCSAQACANTRTGRLIWGLPRRRPGGGRAAVARAWRAQETLGREGRRGGGGRERRVGTCRSWRWSSGCGIGGKRRWQERSRGGSRAPEEEEAGRCQRDRFANLENSRDSSVKKEFLLIQNTSEKNV
jgi:hypothetical protein